MSGDNKQTVNTIGEQLGIDKVMAELLPASKEQIVKQLMSEGKKLQ